MYCLRRIPPVLKEINESDKRDFENGRWCMEHGHWMEWGGSTVDMNFELLEQRKYCKLCSFETVWKLSDMCGSSPIVTNQSE